MSHTVKVFLIADQTIKLQGKDVNVHDLYHISLDEDGRVTGWSEVVSGENLDAKYTALLAAANDMAERLEYHNIGTTHYDGCEADHPDCKVLATYRSLIKE